MDEVLNAIAASETTKKAWDILPPHTACSRQSIQQQLQGRDHDKGRQGGGCRVHIVYDILDLGSRGTK
jgi:hypothetical protein